MITVQQLSKNFRIHKKEPGLKGSLISLFKRQWLDSNALKSVSMQVGAGEIVGLVGANGAGKTTLVKILAGIIYPTSGSVDILGFTPWERKNEFRRQIALIMGQKAQLWWDLPAADCFLLLQEIYQIPPAQFKESLEFLVETLEVKGQLNIQIRRLSLGERMKMELIAALLHRPRIVFLDEPTIGLDLTSQRAIRKFLLNYRTEFKPAMILTSHYMDDIEELCERIIIVKEGAFVYDGLLSNIILNFATHKIITAQLKPDSGAATPTLNSGEIVSSDGDFIKVKAPRDRIAEVAAALLQQLPVIDLNIEEQDIGTIIEAIMRKGTT